MVDVNWNTVADLGVVAICAFGLKLRIQMSGKFL